MTLTFRTVFGRLGHAYSSQTTRNLRTALKHHNTCRSALEQIDSKAEKKSKEALLASLKAALKTQAEKDKASQRKHDLQLLGTLDAELRKKAVVMERHLRAMSAQLHVALEQCLKSEVAKRLQSILRLDNRATVGAIIRLNRLPCKELDRRRSILLASPPCRALPSSRS